MNVVAKRPRTPNQAPVNADSQDTVKKAKRKGGSKDPVQAEVKKNSEPPKGMVTKASDKGGVSKEKKPDDRLKKNVERIPAAKKDDETQPTKKGAHEKADEKNPTSVFVSILKMGRPAQDSDVKNKEKKKGRTLSVDEEEAKEKSKNRRSRIRLRRQSSRNASRESAENLDPRRRLEDEKWYHGIRTRDDIAPLLRENGDFLVRASHEGDAFTLMLNVKNGNEIDNLMLSFVNGRYTLHYLLKEKDNKAQFETVAMLIAYYRKHRLPNGVRLLHGVRRPTWLLRHNAITYDKSGLLGSGNFCNVYRGKVTIDDKVYDAAIKICHPPTREVSKNELLDARTSMINEVKMMARYRHPNVIKFYGVACDRPPVMILMELCVGGSMDVLLRERGKQIENSEKLLYLLEISKGMRYLHSVNCVHRDLAARNCLITGEGIIKVSDFGLSVVLENGKTMCKSVIQAAPIRWFAPECCYKEPVFSKKTDVWAFGTLMFEVFSNGSKPFLDKEDLAIIRAIRKADMPPPPDGTPKEVSDLWKKIWSLKAEDRPPFRTIVNTLLEIMRKTPSIDVERMIINQLKGVKRVKPVNLGASHTISSMDSIVSKTIDVQSQSSGDAKKVKA